MPDDRRGFTLIELLVTMTVAAALMTLTTLPLASALDDGRPETPADALRAAHSLARTTAVRHGRLAELRIDPEAKRFWVQLRSADGGGDEVLKTYEDLGDELTMSSDRRRVCFEARGMATMQDGCEAGNLSVIFERDGRADTVRTSLTGSLLD